MTVNFQIHKVILLMKKLFILALPFSWMSTSFGSTYRLLFMVIFVLYMLISNGRITLLSCNKLMLYSSYLYFGYIIFSTLWSVNRDASLNYIVSVLQMIVMSTMFALEQVLAEEKKAVERCWILVGGICVLLFFTGGKTQVQFSSRMTLSIAGTQTDPNEFASIFIIAIVFAINEVFLQKKLFPKIILITLILLELNVTLMSGSRGALLSVCIAVVFCVMQKAKLSLKRILSLAVIILVAFFVITEYILPMLPQNVLTRLTLEALKDDGGSGRYTIWTNGVIESWNGSFLHLLLGHGRNGLNVSSGYSTFTGTMHNQLIQQIVDYGIVGLCLYLNYLFQCYRVFKRNNMQYLPALWGMMLMSMTITMSAIYKPLWLLLYMAYFQIQQREFTCLD